MSSRRDRELGRLRFGRIAGISILWCGMFPVAVPAADVTFRAGDPAGPIRPLLGFNAGPMACGEPGNADGHAAAADLVSLLRELN